MVLREHIRRHALSAARAATAFVLAVASAGCTVSSGTSAEDATAWQGRADVWGFLPDGRSPLRVLVSGTTRTPYVVSSLGAASSELRVRVRNLGAEPLPVPAIHLELEVTREGVAFPCGPSEPAPREPASIAGGQTIDIARELPCALPVPGNYAVRAFARYGRVGRERPREEVGTAYVDVSATGGGAPVPYPGRPGLMAALAVRTLPSAERLGMEATSPTALIAFTNASAAPIPLGAVHAFFELRREQVAMACDPEAMNDWQRGPARLGPGQTFVLRFPVSCAVGTVMRHDLLAWAALGDVPVQQGVLLGPVRVEMGSVPSWLQAYGTFGANALRP